MALINKTEIRKVYGISDTQLKDIENFLQGAVYCWIKNREDDTFAARDLMGGVNFDWSNTPLMCLFDKHKDSKTNEGAIKAAGVDLGWILKSVLDKDARTFEQFDVGMAKGYQWIK